MDDKTVKWRRLSKVKEYFSVSSVLYLNLFIAIAIKHIASEAFLQRRINKMTVDKITFFACSDEKKIYIFERNCTIYIRIIFRLRWYVKKPISTALLERFQNQCTNNFKSVSSHWKLDDNWLMYDVKYSCVKNIVTYYL